MEYPDNYTIDSIADNHTIDSIAENEQHINSHDYFYTNSEFEKLHGYAIMFFGGIYFFIYVGLLANILCKNSIPNVLRLGLDDNNAHDDNNIYSNI